MDTDRAKWRGGRTDLPQRARLLAGAVFIVLSLLALAGCRRQIVVTQSREETGGADGQEESGSQRDAAEASAQSRAADGSGDDTTADQAALSSLSNQDKQSASTGNTEDVASADQSATNGLEYNSKQMVSGNDTEQSSSTRPADEQEDLGLQAQQEPLTESLIYVHISGEVKEPGVVRLQAGARVFQAVEVAGGFTEQADRDWCNQAMVLADADKLRIYSREETASFREQGITPEADHYGLAGAAQTEQTHADWQTDLPPGTADAARDAGAGVNGPEGAENDKININTASKEELMTLPGIGERRAEDIIAYRERTGGFGTAEELMQVSGIGNAIFAGLADMVTI